MSNSGGRTGSKKMKLFPGVESKTVMTVVKRMWGKMDSHLTLCLQNFSLRSAKGNQYDAGSLRILCKCFLRLPIDGFVMLTCASFIAPTFG